MLPGERLVRAQIDLTGRTGPEIAVTSMRSPHDLWRAGSHGWVYVAAVASALAVACLFLLLEFARDKPRAAPATRI